MANTNPSPNMSLPVPVVGTDPGPQYATDVNSCLTIIDGHNHTSSSGVQVPTAGINLNADLPLNGFNLTTIRSVRFSSQVSPLVLASDLGCLYESGVDLYYNDGNGVNIRLTASGGIAGTPGSISNLTSPASASYVSGTSTFVWQSNVNTPANMDAASYILRNLTVNSFGLTLSPPAAMGSNTTITLPTLPASTSFVTINTTGNMGTISTTAGITASMLATDSVITAKIQDSAVTTSKINNLAVTTAKIAAGAVTPDKLAAYNVQQSGTCGNFTTNSTSNVDVTNLTVTIVTNGRPVSLIMSPVSFAGRIAVFGSTVNALATITLYKDGSPLSATQMGSNVVGSETDFSANISWMDFPGAGSHTYKITAATNDTNISVNITNCNFTALEL